MLVQISVILLYNGFRGLAIAAVTTKNLRLENLISQICSNDNQFRFFPPNLLYPNFEDVLSRFKAVTPNALSRLDPHKGTFKLCLKCHWFLIYFWYVC